MDIDLTQNEIDGLSRAMKKPEFISLLNEYVDEISDPKNKAEQEAYLKQLEEQGELPPGRKLLRPSPHSCIKTFTTSKRKLKCFINLCICPDILQPNLDRVKDGGNWQVPYAMGHPRHDQDKKGHNCYTFDCAFHPKALQLAESSGKFLKLLCDTAISGANTLFQSQGEKVSEDYKLMKNLKCKGGTPGSIMVAEHRMKDPSQPVKEKEKTYKLSEEGPKLYKELVSSQLNNKRQELDEKLKADTLAAENEKNEVKEEVLQKVNGLIIPKHKVLYSSPVDLGEFMENRYKVYKRPKEVVIVIDVPLIESLKDCKIDIKEKHLVFDVKGVYYLEKKLDYDVVEDQASAKFDRKRKELKIVLPIVQVKEVIHQIPDDVPLEVDEIVNNEENFKSEGEISLEKTEKFEEKSEEKVEGNENFHGITEIVENRSQAEVSKIEYENDEKENIQSEIKKLPEDSEKVTENLEPNTNLINSIPKPTRPQPCCIKLKSPLLYTLS